MHKTVCLISTLLASFSISFSQCIIDQRILIPPSDIAHYDDFGITVETDGDYLVVGEPLNDSLEVRSGIVYIYKINAQNKYQNIAQLSPSDPQEFLMFGQVVAIEDTTIITIGNRYDHTGNRVVSLYVFERNQNDEWVSGIESYKIEVDNGFSSITSIAFKAGTLALGFGNDPSPKINLYKKINGIFSLDKQIFAPIDVSGISGLFAGNLSLSENLLAVTAQGFNNSLTNSNDVGAVFLYEKVNSEWSSDPIAKLLPGDRSAFNYFIHFGFDTWIFDNTVFVSAQQYWNQYQIESTVYFFEKPSSNWVNKNEDGKILVGPYDSQFDLSVYDQYLAMSNSNWSSIELFMRSGTSWSTASKISSTPLPVGNGYANQNTITINKNHMLVGLLPSSDDDSEKDQVLDFVPNGDWVNGVLSNQVIINESRNASGDYFGSDISISGNRMAVAANSDQENGNYAGAVFLYVWEDDDWMLEQKILSPEKSMNNLFGSAIEFGGDSILFVSAIYADSLSGNGSVMLHNVGKVYVYKLTPSGWVYNTRILAPQIVKEGNFGRDIAYNDGYVVISEFYDRDTDSKGLVHIYKEQLSKWSHLATLRPSDNMNFDFFGRSLAMNDSIIVVGTGNSEVHIDYNMKVYIYTKKEEWIDAFEDAQLLPSTKLWGDRFGYSVALHKNEIVVGAPGYSLTNNLGDKYYIGAAFLFEKPENGWIGIIQEKSRLLPSDPFQYDSFGQSVAVDDFGVYVGAPNTYMFDNVSNNYNNSDDHMRPGRIYQYIRNGEWEASVYEDKTFLSLQPEWKDGFGAVIKTYNGSLLTGVPLDDTDSGISTGSIQYFNTYFDGISSNSGILSKCNYESKRIFLSSNLNPDHYNWYFKEVDGLEFHHVVSNVDQIEVMNPGIYYAEIFDSACGYYREYFDIENFQIADIVINPLPVICSDQEIQLEASPDGGVWSGNVTLDGKFNPATLDNGEYSVNYSITTQDDCKYDQDLVLLVDKLEKPNVLQSSQTLCTDSPVTLEISKPATVRWIKLIPTEELIGNTLTITISDPGVYVAEVSKYDCSVRSDEIQLEPKPDSLFVPNVFTPNGDGLNEAFEIHGEGISEFYLSIFNRYGKKLFETENPEFKWTGEENSAGIYSWYIRYLNCALEPRTHKGFVQIIK